MEVEKVGGGAAGDVNRGRPESQRDKRAPARRRHGGSAGRGTADRIYFMFLHRHFWYYTSLLQLYYFF